MLKTTLSAVGGVVKHFFLVPLNIAANILEGTK
jgi:hypothetical protein